MGVKSKVAAMAASTAQVPPRKLGGDAWRIPIRVGFSTLLGGAIMGYGYYYATTDFTRCTKSYMRVRDPFIHDPFERPCEWPDNHDEVIKIINTNGRGLKRLNLVGSRAANDEVLSHVAHCCPDLEEFHAAHVMGRITDEGLAVLALGCPKLRVLDLAHVGGTVTDTGVTIFCSELRNLEALRIAWVGDDGVGDGALMSAVMHNPNLQHLNFHGELTAVTDDGLMALGQLGKKLVTLDLGCQLTGYTNKGVRAILKGCDELQLLDVQAINKELDDGFVYDIADGRAKKLKVLKVKTNLVGGYVTEQAVADLRLIRPSVAVYTDEKFTEADGDPPVERS